MVQKDLKERFTHSNSSKADGQRGQRVYNRHDGKGFSQRWRSRHDFALKCAPGAVKGTEVEKMRRDSKAESKCRPSSANEMATKSIAKRSRRGKAFHPVAITVKETRRDPSTSLGMTVLSPSGALQLRFEHQCRLRYHFLNSAKRSRYCST